MMTAGSSFSSHEVDKTRIDNTILMSIREGFCFIVLNFNDSPVWITYETLAMNGFVDVACLEWLG